MKDKKQLKKINSVIQICPICGKVDVYKNDNHDCIQSAQNQINQEYYD